MTPSLTVPRLILAAALVVVPALAQQGDASGTPDKSYRGWTYTAASEYSLGFRGVGFSLQKGTDDNKYTAMQMCRLLRLGFKDRTAIAAECYFEQGKNVNTVITAYIGGSPREPRGVGPTIASFSEYADIHKALAAPLVGCRRWMIENGVQPSEVTLPLAQRFVNEFWPGPDEGRNRTEIERKQRAYSQDDDRARAIEYYQRHFSRHFEVEHNPFASVR